MQYPARREIDPSVSTRGDTPLAPSLRKTSRKHDLTIPLTAYNGRHHEILHLRLDVWQHAN